MNTVVVGKIGAPYGVKGWVKVHSFTEPQANLFTYPLLLDSHKAGWQAVEVEEFKEHGDGFVAKLVNVEDRDQAALITNAQLAVERNSLPELEPDQYYWADLLGLTVFNKDNIELGQIDDFFNNGANEVMVVKGKKEYLIPFVFEQFILDINTDSKQMRVDWPEDF